MAAGSEVSDVAVGDHVVVTLIRSCGECVQCRRGNRVFCEDKYPADDQPRLTAADGEAVEAAMFCGAFADEVIVDHSQVVTIPSEIDWSVASLLACGVITGVGAVMNTSTVDGDSTVVVVGCGGVGLNAVQGARIVGCEIIIAVDLQDEKLETAREFGATHTANAGTEDVREVIREATGRKGVTHTFVTVGSAPAIRQALRYIEPGGEIVIVGMPPNNSEIDIDPVIIAAVGHRIVGSKMGTSDIRRDIPRLIEWYRSGELKLDELVTATYPLESINEAVAAVGDGDVIRNVIVMNR